MERLTMQYDGKYLLCCGEEDAGACACKAGADDCAGCNPCDIEQAAIDRLAAYENTGVEPEAVRRSDQQVMKDIADLQTGYQALLSEKRLTKKAMCDLCVPFRDKYGLTDLQALRIARKQMDIAEMAEILF